MAHELYLEDALEECDRNRNVLVYLSSAHAIYGEPDKEPTYIPDSLGNHTVRNWLTAIENNSLRRTFVVRATVDKKSEYTPDQIAIYVDVNAIDAEHAARVLELESNRAGLEELFH